MNNDVIIVNVVFLIFFEIWIRFRRRPPKTLEADSAIGGLLQNYPANPVQHPELNPELDDIKHNLEKIIAFVNPKSGGQKGRIVFERLKNYLHRDNVFDLTKGGPKFGFVANHFFFTFTFHIHI